MDLHMIFGQPQVFADGTIRGPRQYAVGEHPLAVIENTIAAKRETLTTGLRAKFDLPYGIKFEYLANYLSETDSNTDFTMPGAGAFAASNNGLLTNGINNFSAFTNQQLLSWKMMMINTLSICLLDTSLAVQKFTNLSLSKRNMIGDFSPILDNSSVYASASNYNTKYAFTQKVISQGSYMGWMIHIMHI